MFFIYYFNCRKESDITTCVDKLTKFGKQIGFDNGGDLEMSLFFLVQDDLTRTEKTVAKINQ